MRSSSFTTMKAVYLLLCLALARSATGNIFRRQYPQMDGLVIQNLDYIDQQQLNQENPLKQHNSNEQYPQQVQQRDSNEQYQQQQVEGRDSNEYTRRAQKYQQKQPRDYAQQSDEQYPETKKYSQRGEEYQEQIKQRSHRQHHKRQHEHDQKSKEQYDQNNLYSQRYQQTKQKKGERQTSESTSYENSHESREKTNEFATPLHADVLTTRLYSHRTNQHEMKPVYGDEISWRGLKIATGPKSPVEKRDIENIFKDAYKTMENDNQENKKIFHQAYETVARTVNEDAHLNATELLNKYQYQVEDHTIKTDDGYYLTLFRIAPKEQTLEQRPVVFLMHGLLGSADDWLLMGPGKSLAYLLSDAGYEVWLGNARGNKYSRHHVSKHPAQPDFWQFSTDEIALHDLPAMIDYVLKTSNQEKLYYVGHSQGTTAFFALAATRPEYNQKIIMMYALSPMAYMTHVRSPLLKMIAPNSPFSENLKKQLGDGQFKPSKEVVRTVGGDMCEKEIGCKHVCSNVNFVMAGVNVENLEMKKIPVIMSHLPAGASTRQMKQYGQAVASNEFTKYDFGADINQQVYGDRQPPKYEMEKVKAPVALYFCEEDWLAHPIDVQKLEKELPNVKDSYKVPEEQFSHMDFQFSKTAPQVVYKRLIESIQDQQKEQSYVY